MTTSKKTYRTVKCIDCGKEWKMRTDVIRRWLTNRCKPCAQKYVWNLPEMKKKRSEYEKLMWKNLSDEKRKSWIKKSGKVIWEKFNGLIPNRKRFGYEVRTDGTTRNVKWRLEYSIANAGTDAPYFYVASTTFTTADLPILSTEMSLQHRISSFGTITNTYKIGAYIVWKLTRVPGTDTAPSDDPFALALGFHIIQDTMGSRQLYIK